MKKVVLFGLLAIGMAFAAHSQRISKNALGLRFGDDDGFDSLGAEISYQRALFNSTRLEFDLGYRNGNNYDAFKLVGLFQWVMPLDQSFYWYVGAGAGLGSVSVDNGGSNSFALLAGDIGIEYNFRIPLLLSLDIRPELGFGD
ncbi:MAG: hypothetical protein KDD04_08905, partial [Sinomicrobium sp.]|nr:hypothetical protein [Sinomicrobium sp.]